MNAVFSMQLLNKDDNCKPLFNVMYNCWIWAAKYCRYKEVFAVSDFFMKTDSYADVVLKLINSERNQYFYIVIKTMLNFKHI